MHRFRPFQIIFSKYLKKPGPLGQVFWNFGERYYFSRWNIFGEFISHTVGEVPIFGLLCAVIARKLNRSTIENGEICLYNSVADNKSRKYYERR